MQCILGETCTLQHSRVSSKPMRKDGGGRERFEKPQVSGSVSHFLTSIWLILAIGLAVRVGFLLEYTSRYSRHALGVIPFLFESGNIAYSLATGEGFSSPFRVPTGPTAWSTPVYPLLLSLIFRAFGTYTFASFLCAVILNLAFVTFASVPLFFAAKRITSVKVAAAACWIWALFPNAILIPMESLWEASLSALLVAAILWGTLRVDDSRAKRAWLLYGLFWGFTLMANPSIAAVLPFLLGWLVWRGRRVTGRWLNVALSCLIIFLCCVPWTIRNFRVFHEFVPLRSVAGLTLWLGNNERAQPRWNGQQHPIADSDERESYINLGELDYMREKRNLALAYMVEHPGRELELIGRRFLAFWSGGTPFPVKDFLSQDSIRFRYVLLFNVAIAIGTLVGLIMLARRKNPYWFPLAVFPIVFPLTYYLTMVVPRYRLPIDPVLILLTAIGIANLGVRPSENGKPTVAAVPR